MALTECPECRGKVSESALTCPHCGFPVAPVATPQPPAITGSPTPDTAKLLGVGSIITGGAFIFGSVLPWITARAGIFSESVNGVEGGGDGIIVLILGILLVAAGGSALVGFTERVSPVFLGIDASIAAGLIAINLPNINDRISTVNREPLATASYGVGLYVIGGGVLVAAITIANSRKQRQATPGDSGLLPPAAVATSFVATHRAPSLGSMVRESPDPEMRPMKSLKGETPLRVVEQRGEWAYVVTADGSTGWVDARPLVAIARR